MRKIHPHIETAVTTEHHVLRVNKQADWLKQLKVIDIKLK